MVRSPNAPRRSLLAAGVLLLLGAAASVLLPGEAPAQEPTAGAQPQRARAVRGRLRLGDSTMTQILRTRDGSVLVGRIVALDSTSARVELRFGTVDVPLAELEEVQEVKRLVESLTGDLWLPDPNTTRLLFAPTGRQLKRGEGYFSDYMLFFPGFAYGMTDELTIGGGMSILPTGPENQLFYVTPKVGIVQSEKVNMAVGALVVSPPGDGDFDNRSNTLGLLYWVGTFGRPEGSLTLGVGYGFEGGELADNPAIMLGGVARGTRRTALVTENYLLPGSGALFSGGVRFLGERLAVDLGLFSMLSDDDFSYPLPFVGFVVNF
jgi:hypothetical protein